MSTQLDQVKQVAADGLKNLGTVIDQFASVASAAESASGDAAKALAAAQDQLKTKSDQLSEALDRIDQLEAQIAGQGASGPTTPAVVKVLAPGDGKTATDLYKIAWQINAQGQLVKDGSVLAGTDHVSGAIIDTDGRLVQYSSNKTDAQWRWMNDPSAGFNGWAQETKGQAAPADQTSTPAQPTTSAFPAHWSRLHDGINVERSDIGLLTAANAKYLHDEGVKHLRVFLDPDEYLKAGTAMSPDTNPQIQALKKFMDTAIAAGLAIVVTPFAQEAAPYLSNPNDTASINQYSSWLSEFAAWVAKTYKETDVFIEIRNEAVLATAAADTADSQLWWTIQGKFIDTARKAAPKHTVVAGPNWWNDDLTLINMTPYADQNVVYSIHMYQPMDFTHQGVSWMQWASVKNRALTDGDIAYVQSRLQAVADWATKNKRFVMIGEFGCINSSDVPKGDRVKYLKTVREFAELRAMGEGAWDYSKAFAVTVDDGKGNRTFAADIAAALGLKA